jgi:hypothetical protein
MLKTPVALTVIGVVLATGLVLDLFISGSVPDTRAESFNVKPGAWEMTVTMVAPSRKLSPGSSTKMTPEQQARMKQMRKANKGTPRPLITQSCLTPADVAHDRIIKELEDEDDDEEVKCTVKVISKSSSKLVLDQICPGPPTSTTHMVIEAKTPERIVAIGDRELQGSGKSRMEIKGQWLDATCDGIEE